MAELKAGGMALVFGLKKSIHNNGKSVRLLEIIQPKSDFTTPDGDIGFHHDDSAGWVCRGNIVSINGDAGWAIFDAKNLMPIDGDDFQHEDERQKELTHG